MVQKNDERIIELKTQIEKKKQEMAKNKSRFVPETNCLLVLDKVTYNLHVENLPLLLIKMNMIAMSAKDLDMDITEVIISGYSLDQWITDIKNNMEVQTWKKEKRKLDVLEKQLITLLSDDKKTELEIDNIAALLGGDNA